MALELVKLDSETLPGIADAIRGKTGETALLLPSEMAAAIAGIPTGGSLPALTTPAAEKDVLAGKEYIDGSGAKKAGTLVVCDTVQEVETFGLAGTGVHLDIESTADASGKTLTLPEPNLKSENIKSGINIFGVLGTLSLSLFDNETDCEMGTFELAEDKKDGYVVSLKRTDSEPYMIAFWMDDPKFTDDSGNTIRYRIGGVFIKSSLQNIYSCAGIVAANGSISSSTGGAGTVYRVYPESGGIFIGSSSTYPLKAGVRYKWIARWLIS